MLKRSLYVQIPILPWVFINATALPLEDMKVLGYGAANYLALGEGSKTLASLSEQVRVIPKSTILTLMRLMHDQEI